MKKLILFSEIQEDIFFLNKDVLKELNNKGNYELFADNINLGTIINDGSKMKIHIDNDICSTQRWEKEKIFDKIIKNTEINKFEFDYDFYFVKSFIEYEKENGKLKIERFIRTEDIERNSFSNNFFKAENYEWRDVFSSDLIKEISFELRNNIGGKLFLKEQKTEDLYEITDFIIETVNDRFEFYFHNNEIKKEGELKYGEAIFLEELFKKEHKGVFMEEIREKVDSFKNIIEETDYLGYTLKKFKNEESEDFLKGLKILNIFDECISVDKIGAETLENVLATAKEFPRCDVFSYIPDDFPFSIFNRVEKNELAIFLYEDENISKMAKIYNIFKNEPNFSYFKDCPIEMHSPNGILKISSDRNNMIYKAKTEKFCNENMLNEAKKEMGLKILEKETETETKKNAKVR